MCRFHLKKAAVNWYTAMVLKNTKSKQKYLPDVVILCGGQGTRFRQVASDIPKALASVGNGVFLDILLKSIFNQGFKRVILAVGHMKEKIIQKYSRDDRMLFSEESEPLGTGGAAMKALKLVRTENFVVMNGDCHSEVDLKKMYAEHLENKPLITMALAEMEDVSDYGSVSVGEANKILAFEEKSPQKRAGLVNAGVYIFNKKIVSHTPGVRFSLERDLFPAVILEKPCYAHIVKGGILDIGIPERYNLAKQKFAKRNNTSFD